MRLKMLVGLFSDQLERRCAEGAKGLSHNWSCRVAGPVPVLFEAL